VRDLSKVNPLSYEVDALRGLLVGTHANLWLDFGVLVLSVVLGVTASSRLIDRLAR
jgi:ABC-2 type transport system permease protein